jgi:hypothetical protein
MFMLAPLTVNVPVDCDNTYCIPVPPDIGVFIVYEYEPFGSVNVIVFVVELCVIPFNVINHNVPDGNPLSVNVISYTTNLKETEMFKFDPFTVNDPFGLMGAYSLLELEIEYV